MKNLLFLPAILFAASVIATSCADSYANAIIEEADTTLITPYDYEKYNRIGNIIYDFRNDPWWVDSVFTAGSRYYVIYTDVDGYDFGDINGIPDCSMLLQVDADSYHGLIHGDETVNAIYCDACDLWHVYFGHNEYAY